MDEQQRQHMRELRQATIDVEDRRRAIRDLARHAFYDHGVSIRAIADALSIDKDTAHRRYGLRR